MAFEWQTCPVCGKPWRPFAGTKLTAHAWCSITLGAFEFIGAMLVESPCFTIADYAAMFDVSLATARCWIIRIQRGEVPPHLRGSE